MANLDRFGGPDAWDAYCDAQDQARARLIASNPGCAQCDECTLCDTPIGYEHLGYCEKHCMIVELHGEVPCEYDDFYSRM